jgi:hypothetical protein
MTAFEQLELELRAGVRRAHGSAEPRRAWRRPVVLALAAALVVVAAALAATGTIRIGAAGDLKPRPHVFAGVRVGAVKLLALRVADPADGPPWALRVFDSSRGGHCVQIGRVDHGRFVAPGATGPAHAWPGGETSLCSGQARNGFPVVRGLQRVQVGRGGMTLLRYGLLGPGARRVRLIAANGASMDSARTSPRIGGAYLFAVPLPAPANRERPQLPEIAVIATFANGRTLRVSGRHRFHGLLPGLGTRATGYAPPPPRRVPVDVRVAAPGRFAVVTVSFRAPVAISRFDVHYTQTLRGPIGRTCTPASDGYNATKRDIAAGQIVSFTLRRGPGFRENGREGWCPGRFTGAIRYSTPGRNTTIGRFAFAIR